MGLALSCCMTLARRPIRLPPTLTADTRDALRDEVLYLLSELPRDAVQALTLDASAVRAVDAAGLGVLVLLEKRATEAGVRLVLDTPSPALRAMLHATALASLFLPSEPRAP
jgi:anti-anti-sigma factor